MCFKKFGDHQVSVTFILKISVVFRSFNMAINSFYETVLDKILSDVGATTLLICGMMTQNCVTHTAISKAAEKYEVVILPDCCTTVSDMIHNIALRAVSTRLKLEPSDQALK